MLLYPALKNHAYVMTSYIQQGDEILSILFQMESNKCVNQIIFQTKGYWSHLDISKYVPNDQLLNSRCIQICIKELTFIVDTHCSCIIHTFFLSLLCHWLLPSPHAWFLNLTWFSIVHSSSNTKNATTIKTILNS